MKRAIMNTVVVLTAIATCGIVACKKTTPKKQTDPPLDTPTTMASATTPTMARTMNPPAPADADAPYRCAQDGDCIRTCGQGVVNRAWHKKHFSRLERCKDGCAGPRRLKLTCEAGSCVGRGKDGKINTYCTRKKIRWLNR